MTTDEFVELYQRSQISRSINVDQYPLYLMLRKPTNLDYVVAGLMDRDDRHVLDNPKSFRKAQALGKTHVNHTFKYRMHGTAAGIEGCFEKDCELGVNTGGIGEYRDREKSATIGQGRYAGGAFTLHLDVAPEIAVSIIQRRLYAPEVEQEYNEDEDKGSSTIWMRLTVDSLNLQQRKDDVYFSIGTAYFSSVFSPLQFF